MCKLMSSLRIKICLVAELGIQRDGGQESTTEGGRRERKKVENRKKGNGKGGTGP